MESNGVKSQESLSCRHLSVRCLCCMQALEADRNAAMKECQQSCPQLFSLQPEAPGILVQLLP